MSPLFGAVLILTIAGVAAAMVVLDDWMQSRRRARREQSRSASHDEAYRTNWGQWKDAA